MSEEIKILSNRIEKILSVTKQPSRESRHLSIALKELNFLLAYLGE
jgi:hypothetical protein